VKAIVDFKIAPANGQANLTVSYYHFIFLM